MVENADAIGTQGNISAMHPHGIVPFQALFWAAYTTQYLEIPATNTQPRKSLYGFAAAANVVFNLPFVRNILGLYSTHGANYQTLKDGLLYGKCIPVNNGPEKRKPRHLFLLPGGIAEVFTSEIGRHAIVFKERRGLCRLALEVKSEIIPIYIFGGNDFYHNLFSGDSFGKSLERFLLYTFFQF